MYLQDQLHGIALLHGIAPLTVMEQDLKIILGPPLTQEVITVPVKKNISPLVKKKNDLTVGVY